MLTLASNGGSLGLNQLSGELPEPRVLIWSLMRDGVQAVRWSSKPSRSEQRWAVYG